MNTILKPNKSPQKPVDFYSPDGHLICTIDTEYEFHDLRIQIMNEKLDGFYFIFEGKRINVGSDGRIDFWPEGFFDHTSNQLSKILSI